MKSESITFQNEVFLEILKTNSKGKLYGNHIFHLETLLTVSLLCCPLSFKKCLDLTEDSTFRLCSNFQLKCKNWEFVKGFWILFN